MEARTGLPVALGLLLLAGVAGCSNPEEEMAKFQAEQKAAATGYWLEHFPKERVLFVHRPGGEKDGVDLATTKRVFLSRTPAREATDGKKKYWLHFDAKDDTLFAPFFGIDPEYVIGVLRVELPDFDEATARKMIATFQKDAGTYCNLWATDAYLKELGENRQHECTAVSPRDR